MTIPNIWKVIKNHVPKHQSGYSYSTHLKRSESTGLNRADRWSSMTYTLLVVSCRFPIGISIQYGAQWCERWFRFTHIHPMNTIVIRIINRSETGVMFTDFAFRGSTFAQGLTIQFLERGPETGKGSSSFRNTLIIQSSLLMIAFAPTDTSNCTDTFFWVKILHVWCQKPHVLDWTQAILACARLKTYRKTAVVYQVFRTWITCLLLDIYSCWSNQV